MAHPLLDSLNETYLAKHFQKEDSFWKRKMALKSYKEGSGEQTENEYRAFTSDSTHLKKVQDALSQSTGLSKEDAVALEGWKLFFQTNQIQSLEAQRLADTITEMESTLESKRRSLRLSYVDPVTGNSVEGDQISLGLTIKNNPDERVRKAAYAALESVGPFILKNGFLEIIQQRNRLSRMLGYSDYYSMKVEKYERFSKQQLFDLLGKVLAQTKMQNEAQLKHVAKENGAQALRGWNYSFFTAKGLTEKTDPYFRPHQTLARWGTNFWRMGVRYSGAKLNLDLISRDGKYPNGFMHAPVPCYIDGKGRFIPAQINFTSVANPKDLGAGATILNTLLHEGGHAAHFSNIKMHAPCFSQEFAPTSVAFAETQSMFMDSLMAEADWKKRYALSDSGASMPDSLILESMELENKMRGFSLRSILAVSFVEKALYEMPDRELTAENVLKTVQGIEQDVLGLREATRPILSVPHLLSGESSAYYHGYALAEMAVYQIHDFFQKRDGYVLDNANIGPTLSEIFWKPGNQFNFLQFMEKLTGNPFDGIAAVNIINSPQGEALEKSKIQLKKENQIPKKIGLIDLEAEISIIHGDQKITSNSNQSFETMTSEFETWIKALE